MTANVYTFKDSSCAAERIQTIHKELFDDGYAFLSFDVTLFTNVPPERTIKIILDPIYNQNVVTTNLYVLFSFFKLSILPPGSVKCQ